MASRGIARVAIEYETSGNYSLTTRLTILASPHPIRDGERIFFRKKKRCQISSVERRLTVLKSGRDAHIGLVPVHTTT